MGNILRDLILFSALSFLPYFAHGEEANQRVSLARGTLVIPPYPARSIAKDVYCDLVKEEWGWSTCENIDAMIYNATNGIDTVIVNKPTNDGYVEFDDWESSDKDEAINEIEAALRASVEAQSKATGDQISLEGWHTYPSLDQDAQLMIYATKLLWGGESIVNITATKFDRYGYVEFSFVPDDPNLSESSVYSLVSDTLKNYESEQTTSYASFTTGDKVAAAGALGVLATLVGVKYGKGFLAAAFAVILVFLKKAWIVVLLPFYWIGKKLFSRKTDE
jgi:uncharacterized membrane-anchored protein